MRDDPAVTNLVTRARNGDKRAWDELVERYAPLVWSICRRYRLDRADADDIGQSVWLRLVEHLGGLREPAALPGWLATTTQRECTRVIRAGQRAEPVGDGLDPVAAGVHQHSAAVAEAAVEEEVLRAERHDALREAFTCLPPECQRLISMLVNDPPVPYAEISSRLGIPVGSIGPSRARCLDKLRRSPPLAALIDNDVNSRGGDRRGRAVVE
jgi:RNA polymerase sigma factor (sigma-70 family)